MALASRCWRVQEATGNGRPSRIQVPALPGFVWVEVEAAAVEVDGRLEVLGVAEATGRVLDASRRSARVDCTQGSHMSVATAVMPAREQG
jgi:hypothetical protein